MTNNDENNYRKSKGHKPFSAGGKADIKQIYTRSDKIAGYKDHGIGIFKPSRQDKYVSYQKSTYYVSRPYDPLIKLQVT